MSDDDPEAALAEHARALADAIGAALGPWIVASVTGRGGDHLAPAAEAAAAEAEADVMPRIRALVEQDADQQATTPLALLRTAVAYPTAVLRKAGVPPVARDEWDERAFPEDVYALGPASFEEVSPALKEPGLVWGAAKAYVHLSRRRGRGEAGPR